MQLPQDSQAGYSTWSINHTHHTAAKRLYAGMLQFRSHATFSSTIGQSVTNVAREVSNHPKTTQSSRQRGQEKAATVLRIKYLVDVTPNLITRICAH